jgi:hypothetical protein
MLDAILRIYERIFKTKTSQLALTAFTLSVAFTIVVFILLSVGDMVIEGKEFKAAFGGLPLNMRIFLVLLFTIVFTSTWYILYLQYVREAEDIYSRLREKILGNWVAEYDYIIGDQVAMRARPRTLFTVTLSPDKKFQFSFDTHDHPLFDDRDNIVSDIALRYVQSNKYAMIFYFKGDRKLRSNIVAFLESDHPGDDPSVIEIETVSILSLEDTVDPRGKITKMEGEWFDLNGSLRRLGVLARKIDEAQNEKRTFKVKMWQCDPENDNLSAKMGQLVFSRMN